MGDAILDYMTLDKVVVLDIKRVNTNYTTYANIIEIDRIVAIVADKLYTEEELLRDKPIAVTNVGLVKIDEYGYEKEINELVKYFKNKYPRGYEIELSQEYQLTKELVRTFTGYISGNCKPTPKVIKPTKMVNEIRHKLTGKRRTLKLKDAIEKYLRSSEV